MRRKLSGSAFTENRISLHGSRLAVMTSTVLCCKSLFYTSKNKKRARNLKLRTRCLFSEVFYKLG